MIFLTFAAKMDCLASLAMTVTVTITVIASEE